MKLPTSDGYDRMRTVVRQRLSTYTITRPHDSSSKEALGEELPDEGATTHQEDLWLFAPRDNPFDSQFGNRLEGSLRGLALPGADLRRRDRVTHQGVEYEVNDVIDLPDESTQVLKTFGLDKKVN